MPAELPGYHFDVSKNRYFKITANHVARGSSSTSTTKYSRQAVKAQQALEQSDRRQRLLKASRDAITVKWSKLLRHPLLTFESRLGDRRKSAGATVKEHYAASLSDGRPAINPDPIKGRSGLGETCGKFAVEEPTGQLITLANGCRMNEMYSICLFSPAEDSEFLYAKGRTLPNFSGIVNVDHILSLGRHGVNVWAHRRFDAIRGGVESRATLSVLRQSGLGGDANSPSEEMGLDFRLREGVAGLAAAPSHDAFASAEPRGVMIRWPGSESSKSLFRKAGSGTTTTSVWFKDENIVISGARGGEVIFSDLRSTAAKLDTSVLRIQHDSAISQTRTIGPHQVLVHGLTSTSLYDLRWCPAPRITASSRHSMSPTYGRSQAYVNFDVPKTRRPNRFGLGFAYDRELNMVMAATTDFHQAHHVNLWDASTGQLVQSPLLDHLFAEPVTCAQFVDVRPQAKSILLASAGSVQEWCPL